MTGIQRKRLERIVLLVKYVWRKIRPGKCISAGADSKGIFVIFSDKGKDYVLYWNVFSHNVVEFAEWYVLSKTGCETVEEALLKMESEGSWDEAR